jgi:hypothetical protein
MVLGSGVHESLHLPDWALPAFVLPAFAYAGLRLALPRRRLALGAVCLILVGGWFFVVGLIAPEQVWLSIVPPLLVLALVDCRGEVDEASNAA